MSFQAVDIVKVIYQTHECKVLLGHLVREDRNILFEYDSDFLKLNLPVSPFQLPLRSGIQTTSDQMFGRLFGVFNDSLPDGWGRLLLDQKLRSLSINPMQLTPLDRLCCVGMSGMGALAYEPDRAGEPTLLESDLNSINKKIQIFQKDQVQYVEELLQLGGSSAGARPKVLLTIDKKNWLIKFRSASDPVDIGPIEYAYYLMAKHAGITMPYAQLFPAKQGGGYFGVKRFDRTSNEIYHLHSLGGLLHADYRIPSLDYETVLKATMMLTNDMKQCLEQYRRCVFNVFSHNRDDHAKNFSFLMDGGGQWHVSPAYDLTFSSGPNGEHSSSVMGEGRQPGQKQLLALAHSCSIDNNSAVSVIDEVKQAVSQWDRFAKLAVLSHLSRTSIGRVLNELIRS